MIRLPQADGGELLLPHVASRIVSLVPSITETLVILDRLPVGRTSFCVHPQDKVKSIPVVGGTKTPKISRIVELEPDLVLANKEENRREDVEELREKGLAVWVSHPTGVRQVPLFLGHLGWATGTQGRSAPWINRCRTAVGNTPQPSEPPRLRVVTLIWKEPWMAVGEDTYIHSLVTAAGGDNPLAEKEGRYPKVTEDEIVAAQPEVLLLPSEPYAFGKEDQGYWQEKLGEGARVELWNGEDLSWFGPRLATALPELRKFLLVGNCSATEPP